MKLSIIVPSIRPENIQKLFDSVDFEGDWEMIVVGPKCPLFFDERLKYIHSMRSPNASQQIGLLQAKGEYITFAADDGEFLRWTMTSMLKQLILINDYKFIYVGKYLEGDNPNPDMLKEDYYKFKYHEAYQLDGVPQDQYIFNCGIISRKFILELGGWDAENFNCTTMAHADLGIRADKAFATLMLRPSVMFKCTHQPKRTGDHGPIHNSMIRHDIPNFKKLYSKPNNRIKIDINNWEKTPSVWKERFKQ